VSKWRQWRRKSSVFCGITKQNHRFPNRRSPCIKRSTFRSVLICLKKILELSYILEKYIYILFHVVFL